jgi:hypothetical protein
VNTILFDAPRIRNGQRIQAELVTKYIDDGHGLPILVVLSNYSARQAIYRRSTTFRVEEVPTPLGRGFILHRNEDDVAADGPEADTSYEVLVAANSQDHICTCRGHQRHGHCRHHDSIRTLLEAGHIDHPGERPAQAEPIGPAPW